jgi:hypothetical protein
MDDPMNNALVTEQFARPLSCDVCHEASDNMQWYGMTSRMTCGAKSCRTEMDAQYQKHCIVVMNEDEKAQVQDLHVVPLPALSADTQRLIDMQESMQQKIVNALGVPARYLGYR